MKVRVLIALLLCCGIPAALTAQVPSQGHGAIYALAFSPDGKQFVAGMHGRAMLYNLSDWTVAATFTKIESAVRSLAFHPDGKHVAVGSGIAGKSGDLLLWDLTSPDKIRWYSPARDTIEALAFARDGSSLLSASFDSKARFYPQTFFAYGNKLEEHNGRVTAVAFSPKPQYIFVTGAMDKMVKVWDFRKTNVVVNFDQAAGGITGLGFLSNGDQFVGSSLDGNLYWWGVNYDQRKRIYSGYHFRTIAAHEGGVTAFGMSANQQRMVTGGSDKKVRIWKVDDGGLVREFTEPDLPLYCAALSPDGKIAAAAGRDGVIWVWDVDANKLLVAITPPPLPNFTASAAK